MKLTPPISSVEPKVKRGWPAMMSMPMVAMNRPSSSETSPFKGLPVATKAAQVRPNVASQKYSKVEKLSATSASSGAVKARIAAPTSPPTTPQISAVPSPRLAWPLSVRLCVSST